MANGLYRITAILNFTCKAGESEDEVVFGALAQDDVEAQQMVLDYLQTEPVIVQDHHRMTEPVLWDLTSIKAVERRATIVRVEVIQTPEQAKRDVDHFIKTGAWLDEAE